MKILHLPFEIAGQMQILTKYLQDCGYKVNSAVFKRNLFGYENKLIPIWWEETQIKLKLKNFLKFFEFLFKNFLKYDIYHFYFGGTFLSDLPGFLGRLSPLDLLILKKYKKKIIFHFFGCDIRDKEKIKENKYNPCRNCKTNCNQEHFKRNIQNALKFADKIIIASPDLFDFIKDERVIFVPTALNLDDYKTENPYKDSRIFKIIHAPTNREIKGTGYIIAALNKLKQEGFNLELILAEGIPHKEAKSIYRQADLAVDQLLTGSYGLFAVETMAMNIPTLCYIRDDLIKYYPKNLPIIKTNLDTLYNDLKSIITNKKGGNNINSRKYISDFHGIKIVAQKIKEIYESFNIIN
ncbi:MAG: glycosyltransferase [Armatimonadetes bacterium]|nr:glycosyltransferase [Armatimonadota bacterium]